VGRFPTGGKGGKEAGAPVDALASQGGLAATDDGRFLVALNAGSGTVSTLRVLADGLEQVGTTSSRGDFPSSATVRGSLVYVLNAGGAGSVSGYRLVEGQLVPIAGAVASLGLANAAVPRFITAPAQVGVTPDGATLVVTTKANNTIITFPVRADGTLGSAVTTPSQGPVPFSFAFDAAGRLQVQQAGDGRNASYAVNADSSLTPLGLSAPSGGAALCWSVRVGGYLFGVNAGSGTITSWRLAADGTSTIDEAVAGSAGGGLIDVAASRGGKYVYALNAVAGTVTVFANDRDGGLTSVGSVDGLPVIDGDGGPEGIVAL
jgi:6-phosphogluconolactonase (cycloisomerase 2 family)